MPIPWNLRLKRICGTVARIHARFQMHRLKHGAVCLITGKNDSKIRPQITSIYVFYVSRCSNSSFSNTLRIRPVERNPNLHESARPDDSSVSKSHRLPQDMPAAKHRCARPSLLIDSHTPSVSHLRVFACYPVFPLPFNTEGFPVQ